MKEKLFWSVLKYNPEIEEDLEIIGSYDNPKDAANAGLELMSKLRKEESEYEPDIVDCLGKPAWNFCMDILFPEE
jgi:hypothetical protein